MYKEHFYNKLIDWSANPRIKNPDEVVKTCFFDREQCSFKRMRRYEYFVHSWRRAYQDLSNELRYAKRSLKKSHRAWNFSLEEVAWKQLAGWEPGIEKPTYYEEKIDKLKSQARYMLLLRHHMKMQFKLEREAGS